MSVARSKNEIKDLKEIPKLETKPVENIKLRDHVRIYDPRPKERVVDSEHIKWKPIDKVAAKVVAKAPWYYKIDEEPKYMNKETKAEFSRTAPQVKSATVLSDKGFRETVVDGNGVTNMCASTLIKETPKTLSAAESLVERAQEASDALGALMHSLGPGWMEYKEVMNKGLVECRQTRIALEMETRQIMSSFKEVRAFFMDDKHQEEVARLEKFVNLCHQLNYLKKSGFLDAVSETILKLGMEGKE